MFSCQINSPQWLISEVMKVSIIFILFFALEDHLGYTGTFTKHCLCPHYDTKDSNVGFCGHEIIKIRTEANQPFKKCIPTAKYACVSGPNRIPIETICKENEKCIPGSPLYDKIKTQWVKDFSRNTSRGCATQEGLKCFYFKWTTITVRLQISARVELQLNNY